MEQWTSWKVHVPDFVLEKYEHRHVRVHTHTQLCTQTFRKMHVRIHVRERG